MGSASGVGSILVTGAYGHIGRELCRVLKNAGHKVLSVDLDHEKTEGVYRSGDI